MYNVTDLRSKLENGDLTKESFYELATQNKQIKYLTDSELEEYIKKYIPCDVKLDCYEKCLRSKELYEDILYPLYGIEDHFGPVVQDFLFKHTFLFRDYSYYTVDEHKKVRFYSEQNALKMATCCLLHNVEYVLD